MTTAGLQCISRDVVSGPAQGSTGNIQEETKIYLKLIVTIHGIIIVKDGIFLEV